MHTVTIEEIEALATQLETDNQAQRDKLARMIRAEARILAVREPDKFPRRPTEFRDEDGHYDNSYPPKQLYTNRTGPRLVRVRKNATNDIATTSGYYYDWKRVTTDVGLYVDRKGDLWGSVESGTGSLGQFAAHPGDCNVEVEVNWNQLALAEVDLDDLVLAEQTLRTLAFPLQTAASAD